MIGDREARDGKTDFFIPDGWGPRNWAKFWLCKQGLVTQWELQGERRDDLCRIVDIHGHSTGSILIARPSIYDPWWEAYWSQLGKNIYLTIGLCIALS